MSTTTPEEPELQNGVQPEPESKTDLELEPEPESSEPEPEIEPAVSDSVPEPKLESPVAVDADLQPEELKQNSLQSDEADDSAANAPAKRELRKDEGSRTFTMRELLGGLKGDEPDESGPDAPSPYRSASLPFRIRLITFSRFN